MSSRYDWWYDQIEAAEDLTGLSGKAAIIQAAREGLLDHSDAQCLLDLLYEKGPRPRGR